MIVIGLAFAVCILGLILYLASAQPKIMRVGELMFMIGLFAFLCCGGSELVKLIGSR